MVIKAFITNDFIFYNEKKCIIQKLSKDSLQRSCFVKITWHIQKTTRTANQLPSWQRLIDPNLPNAQRNATGTTGQTTESAG